MGQRIIFGLEEVPGYLAGEAGAAGVVVLPEWWGVNEQIQAVADRLAGAGFQALVPDLFRGRVTQDTDEARFMAASLDGMAATETDIAASITFLRQHRGSSRVGVLGFGMGGALATLAAIYLSPHLAAAVSFYGIPPRDIGDPRRVDIPFQGHFGEQDPTSPPRAVSALEAGLQASGTTYELFIYEGARHGFFNHRRPEVYDERTAADAWERSLSFLRRHLLPTT